MNKTWMMAGIAASLLVGGSAVAKEWKINSWQPPRSIEGRMLEDLAKDLAKATNGSLTAKVFAGGQLFGAGAALSGIRDGAVDAGWIVPTLHAPELKHTIVIQNLLPYTHHPYAAAAAAVETIMVNCPECKDDWTKQNTVYTGGHGATSWNVMCTGQVTTLDDLKGKKIRVTGQSATRLVRALGMVAVNMTPPEMAPALQGGQIDCVVGYKAWLVDYGMLDSVKTVIDFPLGTYAGLGLLVTNKKSFDAMSAAERKALFDLMPKYIARGVTNYFEQDKSAEDAAKAKGVKFIKAPADFVAAVEKYRASDLPNIANDLKSLGVADPDKLIKNHLAVLEKWVKLVEGTKGDMKAYEALIQKEIYAKVKF
jgi:TRAP-type C4-dicarboxylate transport system substrate-binding protein